MRNVRGKVHAAQAGDAWREVLKREGRIEEPLVDALAADRTDVACKGLLSVVSNAHRLGCKSISFKDHCRSSVELLERRILSHIMY